MPANRFCAVLGLAVGATLISSGARAHSSIAGLGAFYAQLLHPLVVPAQALLLLAIGLRLGQLGRDRARAGVVVLLCGLSLGLLAAGIAGVASVPQPLLLAGALALGLGVSLDRPWPWSAAVVAAALAGLAVGGDSLPDGQGFRDITLGLAGAIAGVAYLVVVIAAVAVAASAFWQRIGIRIAGAWIAAVAILTLALVFAAPIAAPRSGALTCFAGAPVC